MDSCVKLQQNLINKNKMKTINYKGKGEHSVNELELIIKQQAEELHLLNIGQKQLNMHDVSMRSEQLVCPETNKECEKKDTYYCNRLCERI
jgi:hypothetical protein